MNYLLLRAAGIEYRVRHYLGKVEVPLAIIAANLPVAIVVPVWFPGARDYVKPSWRRTNQLLGIGLPLFRVPPQELELFVTAWTTRDLKALGRWRASTKPMEPLL